MIVSGQMHTIIGNCVKPFKSAFNHCYPILNKWNGLFSLTIKVIEIGPQLPLDMIWFQIPLAYKWKHILKICGSVAAIQEKPNNILAWVHSSREKSTCVRIDSCEKFCQDHHGDKEEVWSDLSCDEGAFGGSLAGSDPCRQVPRYTDTQIHKYTDTQIHWYTDTNTQASSLAGPNPGRQVPRLFCPNIFSFRKPFRRTQTQTGGKLENQSTSNWFEQGGGANQ